MTGCRAGGGSRPRGLRRITLFAIALVVLVFAYYVVADRTTPFTSNARVQAFVVRMAPEVAGQVLNVDVVDNSRVARGDTLFRLDPTPFKIAVEQARGEARPGRAEHRRFDGRGGLGAGHARRGARGGGQRTGPDRAHVRVRQTRRLRLGAPG